MYEDLDDESKRNVLIQKYCLEMKSLGIIAKELNTYANKLRRDAKKLGIKLRDKSEAQKNALSSGTHQHPTKGKERSVETKQKIGMGVLNSWQEMSDSELDRRREISKKRWDDLPKEKQDKIIKLANEAVRKSSKEGSKLEKFLLHKLISDGYKVDFHKEHILSNTKLQIDLYIPSLVLAIEVDGPSHFENIWGDKSLKRNRSYDEKKEGLLIGKGISLIRIKQNYDFSETRASLCYEQLKPILRKNTSAESIEINY